MEYVASYASGQHISFKGLLFRIKNIDLWGGVAYIYIYIYAQPYFVYIYADIKDTIHIYTQRSGHRAARADAGNTSLAALISPGSFG